MPKGYVYILSSDKDKKSYTGSTPSLEERLKSHFNGKVISTRNRRPLRLVYTEEYPSLSEARQREQCLKTRQGRRDLKRIFDEKRIV